MLFKNTLKLPNSKTVLSPGGLKKFGVSNCKGRIQETKCIQTWRLDFSYRDYVEKWVLLSYDKFFIITNDHHFCKA